MNIYSNPNGRPNIIWTDSHQWFANRVIQENDRFGATVIEQKFTDRYVTCGNCGYDWVERESQVCKNCHAAILRAEGVAEFDELLRSALQVETVGLESLPREELVEVHNEIVELLRTASIRDVETGIATVEVRKGLKLSREWDVHYQVLYEQNPRTLLWVALKHSLLGNPLAGEVDEWANSSENIEVLRSSGSGKKLAGAAAVGLLAGFLFG